MDSRWKQLTVTVVVVSFAVRLFSVATHAQHPTKSVTFETNPEGR
jgi:hypothetical protein